jgi:hypothetical protein
MYLLVLFAALVAYGAGKSYSKNYSRLGWAGLVVCRHTFPFIDLRDLEIPPVKYLYNE